MSHSTLTDKSRTLRQRKDCDAFGEKVIAAQHEFEANKTLQKPKQSTGNTVYPPGLSEDKPISDSSKKNLLTVRESSIKSEAMGRTGDIMKLRGMVATQYSTNAAGTRRFAQHGVGAG